MYASVILDISIDKKLDYSVPEHLQKEIKKGTRVTVPIRGQFHKGTIFSIKEKPDFARTRPIKEITDSIPEQLFELALWMSRYYCAPLRQVFKAILPAPIRNETKPKQQWFVMRKKTREELKEIASKIRAKQRAQAEVLDVLLKVKKGILLTELLEKTGGSKSPVETLTKKGCLKLDIVRVDRSPLIDENYFKTKPKTLTDEQAIAYKNIVRNLESETFQTHLLFGVTGSGKTEVYLQAIEQALNLDKGAIVLVPEIALTAQMIERFRSRFDGKIAILHHRLSAGERYDEWQRIRSGEAPIVIGARSAIFSPVKNLGLIIVDEEHEQTYKQSGESPHYHARDVAVVRGKIETAIVVLGSATPSLESFANAKSGKYHLSTLPCRTQKAKPPTVHIIDMKKEFEKANGFTHFSNPLLDRIKSRIERGEQTILFLNRRGYHTALLCKSCGQSVQCPHCDLSLTFHQKTNCLACHLCSCNLAPPPVECPSCKSPQTMKYRGSGTEQIEKAIHAVIPNIRTIRMDADTTKHKGSHAKLLRSFGSGKADVLIGTQMIAKGLHFPQVTLVGILASDSSLNIPDFRASERVFQLITQVSGRAGRGDMPGEVIIQTFQPNNCVIQKAAQDDYLAFYNDEITSRKHFAFPPYSRLAKVSLSGPDSLLTSQWAEKIWSFWRLHLPNSLEFLPVTPCGHSKIKDRYRFQFLIKGPHFFTLSENLDHLTKQIPLPKNIRLQVNIDPLNIFF